MVKKSQIVKNGYEGELDDIYYSDEERWQFAKKMSEEVCRHNVSSPETKKMIKDLAEILKDKVIVPKKFLYWAFCIILILLSVAIGFGYVSFERSEMVKKELVGLELISDF